MSTINVNLDNLQEADYRVDFVDGTGAPRAPKGAVTWTSDDASVVVVVAESQTAPTAESSQITVRTVDGAIGTATVRARDENGVGADFVTQVAERVGAATDGFPNVVAVRDGVEAPVLTPPHGPAYPNLADSIVVGPGLCT